MNFILTKLQINQFVDNKVIAKIDQILTLGQWKEFSENGIVFLVQGLSYVERVICSKVTFEIYSTVS